MKSKYILHFLMRIFSDSSTLLSSVTLSTSYLSTRTKHLATFSNHENDWPKSKWNTSPWNSSMLSFISAPKASSTESKSPSNISIKLSNLYLTDKMELKLGGFRFATRTNFLGERKRYFSWWLKNYMREFQLPGSINIAGKSLFRGRYLVLWDCDLHPARRTASFLHRECQGQLRLNQIELVLFSCIALIIVGWY